MRTYDLAVIGSGPGGYVAALYASRHNMKVLVIEKDLVGGTCLNRGCIPTKAMLHCASLISAIKESALYGIRVDGYRFDFAKALSRKEEIVTRLRAGIETLFRANHIDLMRGAAKFLSVDTIRVTGAVTEDIKARYTIIAVGSEPAKLPEAVFDNANIYSSNGILGITELPNSVLIIGGGVIGVEFATIFNAFEVKVTVVEALDRLISGQSREASRRLETILKRRGVEILTSSRVDAVSKKEGTFCVKLSGGREVAPAKILTAVGRRPNLDGLGLDEAGIKTHAGRIAVDLALRTNVKNIYAAGDCINGPLLAHKASYDGILACDNILGMKRDASYENIPNCIYTDPEIASVGLTEEEAKKAYPDLKIARFPYLGSGKAFVIGKTDGYIKIIGDSKGSILGIEIFGAEACDLIGEATIAKEMRMSIKDLSYVVHGHPTLSEIFQEAAHIFCGTGIHCA